MGYQESFLYTSTLNLASNHKDIERILEIFRKYRIRCASDALAECVCRLHFNKAVPPFRKGMEMLVICGERSVQRSNRTLFSRDYATENNVNFSKDELRIMKKVKILFIENAMQICDAEKTPMITVEKVIL